ncbi:MAG: hypothetical protein ACM30G_16870, partial [Micromonosporaceae bacterium]
TERVSADPHLHAGASAGLLLRPALLAGQECAQLERDLAMLNALLVSLPDRLYGGRVDVMGEALGFSPLQRTAIEETWRDEPVMLSRTDLFRVAGGFRAMEVNVHSSLGGIDSGPWHRALLDVPIFAEFAAAHRLTYLDPLDGVAGALRVVARQRGLSPFPSVGIVAWPTAYPSLEARLRRLARSLGTRGFETFACHAGELSIRAGHLHARGRRIDIMYRIFIIDDVSRQPALLGPVLAAHRSGNLVLVMSFLAELVGNKGALAMLADPANERSFDAHERETLGRMIPWTRRVRDGAVDWRGEHIELAKLAELAQHELILKPVGGYGAKGVMPGWTVDQAAWRAQVTRAAGEGWVLQERVRGLPEVVPMLTDGGIELREVDVNWGAFLTGDRFKGMMVRAVPSIGGGVISTSTGALIGGCFFQRSPRPGGLAGTVA